MLILVASLSGESLVAQTEVDQTYIDLSDSIRDKYKDYDEDIQMAYLENESVYTFKRVEGSVSVKESNEYIVMGTQDDAAAYIWTYHDNESTVSGFKNFIGSKMNKEDDMTYPHCESNYSEAIFSSDAVVCAYYIDFESKGERERVVYNKTTDDVMYLSSIYLTETEPVLNRKLIFEIPDWLDMDIMEMNMDGVNIKKSEEAMTDGKKLIFEFTDLRPEIRESMSPGPSYYEPHLVLIFKTYKDEEGESHNLFKEIDDMYKWYSGLTDGVDSLSTDIESKVDELIAEKSTDQEKIESIFYWVQDNIRYIAFEDGIMGFKPETATSVFDKKYGDCKGMANLTKVMLTKAGYDARLTWIGTNRISQDYNYSFPSLANDNHMICTVIVNDEKYFLDATEEFIAFGDYASRIQGRNVMIENGEEFMIEKVPDIDHNRNKSESNMALSWDGDEDLKGRAVQVYRGEEKTNILRSYSFVENSSKDEILRKFLKSRNRNIEVGDYETSDFEDRTSSLELEYDVTIEGSVVTAGDEMYIDLNVYKKYANWDIELPRFTDLYIGYKPYDVGTLTVNIPEGYVIDYLPETVSLKTDDYIIELKYEKVDNTIVLTKSYEFLSGVIAAERAEQWNTDIETMKEFYQDQIVLKKAEE